MKRLKSLTILFFFIFQTGYGQFEKLKIQKIYIHDKELHETIKKYIAENKEKNKLFKDGLGFVTISNIENNLRSGRPINIDGFVPAQKSFTIDIRAYPLLSKNTNYYLESVNFPMFYTIIDNKLILIYDNSILGLFGKTSLNQTDNLIFFKRRSIRKMGRLVEKYALKELPDEYIFVDFFEPNITYKDQKAMLKKKKKAYNYYGFIDFKAKKTLTYEDFGKWKY